MFGSAIQPLSWGIRLKIAIGVAQGLAYLHTSKQQVIYGDFTASNILLDESFNAKLSDFGLGKNGPLADPVEKIEIMKIYGYGCKQLDSEYYEGKSGDNVDAHSDVYNSGVVLLEMLTGQQALDTNRPRGQHDLVRWLKPNLSNPTELRQIMDLRLEGQYQPEGAIQAAQLVMKGLESDLGKRPPMNKVVEALKKIEALNVEKSITTIVLQ